MVSVGPRQQFLNHICTNCLRRRTYSTKKPNDDDLTTTLRLLMRRVPHPVAIVTASFPSQHSSSSEGRNARGMTISSFNTVTLSPPHPPIISFNARRPSETLDALRASGRFLVHLLGCSPPATRLARAFARGNQHVLSSLGSDPGGDGVLFGFEDIPVDSPDGGGAMTLPRLRVRGEDEEDAFCFVLDCDYMPNHSVDVLDHTVVLASVRRVVQFPSGSSPGKDVRDPGKEFCLTYGDTRFWRVGEEI